MTVRNLNSLWSREDGQEITEYAVIVAVTLLVVVGTMRLIGGSANNAFSSVASDVQ